MAEDKGTPGFANIAMVVFAGLVYLTASHTPVLRNNRPALQNAATDTRSEQSAGAARMWEDPFQAAKRILAARGRPAQMHRVNDPGAASPDKSEPPTQKADPSQRADAGSASDATTPAGAQSEAAVTPSPAAPLDNIFDILAADGTAAPAQPQVIVVVVPGEAYEEQAETRRRRRYGVMAALQSSGYSPVEPGRIRLATLAELECREGSCRRDQLGCRSQEQRCATFVNPPVCSLVDQRGCLPFEDFRKIDEGQDAAASGIVRLIWLQEDVLTLSLAPTAAPAWGRGPLCTLKLLASSVLRSSADRGITVLGPSSSDALLRMFEEVTKKPSSARNGIETALNVDGVVPDCDGEAQPYVRLLDFGATISLPDTYKERYLWQKTLPDCAVAQATSCFSRFGPSDDYLAKAVSHELQLRGLGDLRSRVVLLSEWDSVYGQRLNRELRTELGALVGDDNIRDYWYFRGLDGDIPETALGQGKPALPANRTERATGGQATGTAGGEALEADDGAEGLPQVDYIRRLAKEISRASEGRSVGAVGIVGVDVYDKLLALQELRPLFPNAVFFTTDLDARLLAHDMLHATHNLIIASNFGLLPGADLGYSTAPFRDNYETGVYLASHFALECSVPRQGALNKPCRKLVWENSQDDPDKLKASVPTFEVGRTGTVMQIGDFVDPETSAASTTLFSRLVQRSFALNSALALLCLSAVVFASSRAAGKLVFPIEGEGTRIDRRMSWRKRRRIVIQLILVSAMVVLLAILEWPTILGVLVEEPNGEAYAWSDGTGSWIAIGIQVAIAALSAWFLLLVLLVLNTNTFDLAERFKLDTRGTVWQYLSRVQVSAQDFKLGKPVLPVLPDGKLDVLKYWRDAYLNRCAPISRLARSLCLTAAIGSFIWLVSYYFPADPLLLRGLNVRAALRVSNFACLTLMILLASVVVDATMNSGRFVKHIREASSHWPDATVDKYAQKRGFEGPPLGNWIDLQFTRMRTRVVLRLVYFPFIVIALYIVSQSFAERAWLSTVAFGVSVAIPSCLLVLCVVALRLEAERQRKAAIKQAKETISRLSGLEADSQVPAQPAPLVPAATAPQLEILVESIERLQEGAFDSVLQQPVVKAVLLPLSVYGLPLLSQFLPASSAIGAQ